MKYVRKFEIKLYIITNAQETRTRNRLKKKEKERNPCLREGDGYVKIFFSSRQSGFEFIAYFALLFTQLTHTFQIKYSILPYYNQPDDDFQRHLGAKEKKLSLE